VDVQEYKLMLEKRTIEEVSGLVQASFALEVVFVTTAFVQLIITIVILVRRRQNLLQLPFILILLACLALIIDYALEISILALVPGLDLIEQASTPSFRLGKAAFVIHPLVKQFRDVFLLSSLLSILSHRQHFFHRRILYTLFTTHRKRHFDVTVLVTTLTTILIVTVLGAVYYPFQRDPQTYFVYMGMKYVYIIFYVILSIDVVSTTLYMWDRASRVRGYRDEVRFT
jgi:hypothetical protein